MLREFRHQGPFDGSRLRPAVEAMRAAGWDCVELQKGEHVFGDAAKLTALPPLDESLGPSLVSVTLDGNLKPSRLDRHLTAERVAQGAELAALGCTLSWFFEVSDGSGGGEVPEKVTCGLIYRGGLPYLCVEVGSTAPPPAFWRRVADAAYLPVAVQETQDGRALLTPTDGARLFMGDKPGPTSVQCSIGDARPAEAVERLRAIAALWSADDKVRGLNWGVSAESGLRNGDPLAVYRRAREAGVPPEKFDMTFSFRAESLEAALALATVPTLKSIALPVLTCDRPTGDLVSLVLEVGRGEMKAELRATSLEARAEFEQLTGLRFTE